MNFARTSLLVILILGYFRVDAQQPNKNSKLPFRTDFPSQLDFDSIRIIDEQYQRNAVSIQGNFVKDSFKKMPLKQLLPNIKSIDLKGLVKESNNLTPITNSICSVVSGRNFLYQDSIFLYTGHASMCADGNVLVSGQFADYSFSPLRSGAFCMKTTINGDILWGKLFDSTSNSTQDYINAFQPLELQNGSIVLAARTTNKVSGNDDFALMKLDNTGNLLWLKTYASRYWQGFNGSGDFFAFRGLQEDISTGDIYFTGHHWGGMSTITKINSANGDVIWSNGYNCFSHDLAFGLVINPDNLYLFQLELASANWNILNATVISKANGDTLSSKHYQKSNSTPGIYNAHVVAKLNDGSFMMGAAMLPYFEFPVYTGTKDLYHAGIMELDENFNFKKSYGFKNRLESNGSNTRLSLFNDGTGIFTMFDYNSSYTGESQVTIFKHDTIYNQRKRIHINEGLPYEPPYIRLNNGGYMNIKVMGDSTVTSDSCRIEYYRIHSADTASVCLGVKDTANQIWYYDFTPLNGRRIDSVRTNIFSVSSLKTYTISSFTTRQQPACAIISNCDTLDITVVPAVVCPGSSAIVTIHKNAGCGSGVPLVYDSSFVSQVVIQNDSTYIFSFNQTGNMWLHGSLLGCSFIKDSILIQVIPARNNLDLGVDTVVCPGNQVELNAGAGFASYLWQDGSTDSIFIVTAPGTYYVNTINSCGGTFSDSVVVGNHPPIPFSAGLDRIKCNNDTLHISATSGFLNYQWSPPYNINSTSSSQVVVNPNVDTSYYVKAEKTPGCFAFDTIKITVKSSPPIFLGVDTSICNRDSLLLDPGGGFNSYLWNNGAGTQQVYVSQPGTYNISAAHSNGCVSRDTINLVNLHNLPVPELGNDSLICANQIRLLNPGTFANYNWSTGAVSGSININTIGTYWVNVIDNNGCKGTDTIRVTRIVNGPNGFLGIDTSICTFRTIQLSTTNSFNSYYWSTGSVAPFILITTGGEYWLEVEDGNNCLGRDSIKVIQKECPGGVFIPTAFSPNNDGLNDKLIPHVYGSIQQFEFKVYNRWGELVFYTKNLGQGWDGKYKGVTQDANEFVWTCRYKFANQPAEFIKGMVVIVR